MNSKVTEPSYKPAGMAKAKSRGVVTARVGKVSVMAADEPLIDPTAKRSSEPAPELEITPIVAKNSPKYVSPRDQELGQHPPLDPAIQNLARTAVAMTEELFEEGCAFVANGGLLMDFCDDKERKRRPNYPTRRAFHMYVVKDAERTRRWNDARAVWASHQVDVALQIADNTENDYIETAKGTIVNNEHIRRSELRVKTRFQMAAWHDPATFGPKQAAPTTVNVDLRSMTVKERIERLTQAQVEQDRGPLLPENGQ